MADDKLPDVIPDSQFVPDAGQQAPAALPEDGKHRGFKAAVAAQDAEEASRAQQHFDSAPDVVSDADFESDEQKNESLSEQLKGAAEGAASALTLGASTAAEKQLLGVSNEDINRRRETIGHTVGTVASFLAPEALLGKASAISGAAKVGRGVEAAVGTGTLAGRAASEAAQMAIFQGGDEISKMISEDPYQTVGSAVTGVGMAAIGGGIMGGTLHAAGKAVTKASEALKHNEFIADFKSAINHSLENPDPVMGLSKELDEFYRSTKGVADRVYGQSGLKAQELKALAPELNPKMGSQAQDLLLDTGKAIKRLGDDPLARNLKAATDDYFAAISKEGAGSAEIFEAGNSFKKQLQEWSKYNKDIHPLAERAFRMEAKGLANRVKNALEDVKVWGKAGERQAELNKAFSEYLPSLKDFQSKFMTKVGGEHVIDPGKINTYLNGVGKPRAELRQDMLQNFISASEKYREAIATSHANLGLEIPIEPSSLNLAKRSLQEVTPGAKAAEAVIEKLTGQALGGVAGGALGALVGHPFIGAGIGHHVGPQYLNSIVPGLLRAIAGGAPSAAGFEAASALGIAALKGQQAMSKATSALFKGGSIDGIHMLQVADADTEKLRKWVDKTTENPNNLVKLTESKVGHYLPEVGQVIAETAARTHNYLESKKPQPFKHGMFGKEVPPSKAQEAAYTRTLKIAQQPLSILNHLANNTLTLQDIEDIKTMHPDAYQAISQKLVSAVTEAKAAGHEMPYNLRQMTTLFLGQPVDPTLEQSSIAASQMAHMKPPQQQDAQQPAGGAPKGSPKALNKLSENYSTPGQARQQSRQERR